MTTALNNTIPSHVYPQPASYNAVKIDIHNPAVNVPQQTAQPMIYNYPYNPVYQQNEVKEIKQ